jgi:hypothetical protein
MANCSFSIPFSGTAADIKSKAEDAIVKAGGSFAGDTISGNFSVPTPLGEIKGTYTMDNTSPINIKISEKPFFISCKIIEDKLSGYINPVV